MHVCLVPQLFWIEHVLVPRHHLYVWVLDGRGGGGGGGNLVDPCMSKRIENIKNLCSKAILDNEVPVAGLDRPINI